jgi:hypothetical protein
MSIFVVTITTHQNEVSEAVTREFPTDHIALNPLSMIVSYPGTAVDLSAKLGIANADNTGYGGIVTQVSSYFGRANPAIWEFIKSKWGA